MNTTKIFLLGSAALLTLACAQQLDTIDRTQADITRKADLAGEWYFRQTVVQAPFASAYTFVGDQGKLERGVFEIQEDALYFYRTYEFVHNSEQPGMTSDKDAPFRNADGHFVGVAIEGPDGAPIACSNDSAACVADDGGEIPCAKREGCLGADCDMHRKADYVCQTTTHITEALCGLVDGDEAAGAVCIQPRYVYRGAPLAVFAISSHFDVIHDYNSTTGESTNVIVENTSDRHWYEREFMRVAWGHNMAPNYEFTLGWLLNDTDGSSVQGGCTGAEDDPCSDTMQLATGGHFYSIYAGDASGPEYAPVLDFENGYFDFASDYVFGAPLIYYEYWGSYVPLCWFYPWYAGGIYECTTEDVKIRSAFQRVQASDYQALDYNDEDDMQRFGYFRSEREHYDTHYGSTFHGVIRHVNRHRIWEQYVPTADGSLDYAAMTPKPIVYYLSQDYPRELVPEALDLARQWSKPFTEVVTYWKKAAPKHAMFIVCENSKAEADAAIAAATAEGLPLATSVAHYPGDGTDDGGFCLDMDRPHRNGDLRYNFLFSVNAPTQVGLYGYGPPSTDPLTGEIKSATAYNYTAAMRQGANRLADRVLVMAGAKDWRDITGATEIVERTQANVVTAQIPRFSLTDEGARGLAKGLLKPSVSDALTRGLAIPKTDRDVSATRMKALHERAPEVEELLLIPEFRAIHRDYANMGNRALTAEQRDRFALYKWANSAGQRARETYYRFIGERNLYLSDYVDNAYLKMSRDWADQLNTRVCQEVKTQIDAGADLVFDFTRFNRLQGTCAANLEGRRNDEGWTCVRVGTGIADTYWRDDCTIKKLRYQLTEAIIDVEDLNTYDYDIEHYAPSALYFDSKDPRIAGSQKLVKGILGELREQMVTALWKQIYYSVSLHEVGHTLGLRHNFAGSSDALNYLPGYWEHKVEVDADTGRYVSKNLWDAETREQIEADIRNLQYSSIMDYGQKATFGFKGLGLYDGAAIKYGYGRLVEVFNQQPNLDPFRPYLESPTADASSQGIVRPAADEFEEIFTRVHYSQIPNVWGNLDAISDRGLIPVEQLEGGTKVEVPYRFCSDFMAGSYPWCDRRDDGPDSFEVALNLLDAVEEYWIFAGNWYGSVMFSPQNYYCSIRDMFYDVRRHVQYWALNYARYNAGGWWEKKFGVPWHEDINGGLSGTVTAAYAANMFAMQLGRPAPGTYGERQVLNASGATETIYEPIIYTKQGEFTNFFRLYGDQHARAMYNDWWSGGNDQYPVSAGAIYERLAAMEALTDPEVDLLAVDEANDTTKYLVNFHTLFPDQMFQLLGSLVNGNIRGYGWQVTRRPSELLGPGGTYADDNGVDERYVVPRWLVEVPGILENPTDAIPLNPEQVEDYYFPTTKYRIPMLAAYYGMSFLPRTYDKSFLDTTRVFLKEESSSIAIPAGADVIEFQNPLSGRIYVAYKPVGGDDDVYSAYYLVKLAKTAFAQFPNLEEVQKDFEQPDSLLAFIMGKLELMRGMHKAYEFDSSY